MGHVNSWLLLFMVLHSQYCLSFSWYFSSKNAADSKGVVSKFSREPLHSQKGVELLKNAKQMSVSSNSCWQNAFQNLLAGCSQILAVEEYRSRFAWHLSDCFQKDSGRSPFPHCDWESSMKTCLQKLDEDARDVYLEFYVETNSICHQIQLSFFELPCFTYTSICLCTLFMLIL